MKSLFNLTTLTVMMMALFLAACSPPGLKKMRAAQNMSSTSTLSSRSIAANWTVNQQMITESSGQIKVTAKLSSPAATDLSIPFSAEGSSNNPQDHNVPSSGSITILKGAVEGSQTFTIVDDALFESSESILFTITGPLAGPGAVQTVTLADNDPAPSVQFAASAQAISEGNGIPVNATVQVSAASGLPVTLSYQVSGTANNPTDHNLVNGTLTIPAGQTSLPVSFTLADDAVFEGAETVIITLGAPTNASLGATSVHTVTINDNETVPTIQWEAAAQEAAEAIGMVSVRYRLSGPSALPVTANYTVAGTAASGADHNLVNGSVTLAAGALNGELKFSVVDDTLAESDETVVIQMTSGNNASVGTTAIHTVTIKDNDAPPVIEFTQAFSSIQENVATAMVSAKLSRASALPVSVPFVVSGSATNPADHNLANGTITIPAGQTTAAVSFQVVNDQIFEGNETIILSMGAATNATLGVNAIHTATLVDDEIAPTIQFATASQNVTEAAGAVSLQVTLSSVSTMNVSANFTVAGTAVNPADHNLSAATVNIPAGQTSATISFSIVDDTLYEGNENVVLTLVNPVNANLGATSTHTVNITENDAAPTVQFAAAAQTIQESLGVGSLTVTLNKTSSRPVTVSYAVSGTAANPADHNLSAGSVTIPAGSTSAQIPFTLVKDAMAEPDETIIATLLNPVDASLGAPVVHTVTISDVVANPSVDFAMPTQSVLENAGAVTLAVRMNAPGGAAISIPYTVAGTANNPADHNLAAGTISIPAGAISASLNLTVVNDALDENDETIVVTLGQPSGAGAILGANSVHTLTVTDDDNAPTVQFALNAQSVSEAVGNVSAAVNLSAASAKPITIPFTVAGTAVNPGDHNLAAGSVNIPAGSTSANITFAIANDTVFEGNETVIINLGLPTNATLGAIGTQTITITDNETAPTLAWASAAQSVSEGVGNVSVQVNLSGALANSVTVPFTVGGSATSADHNLVNGSLTIPAGSTSATASFAVLNDTIFEGNETVTLTLGNPAPALVSLGATTIHTVTITDNEAQPTVQFALAAQSINENTGAVTATVTLSNASAQAVTVPYTVGGSASSADHNLVAGQLTFPAGSTSQSLNFTLVNDALFESNETVVISFGAPSGATVGLTSVHTVTIVNDDLQPVIQWSLASQSVNEDAGTLTLTAALSAASGVLTEASIAVSGSAAAGSDFVQPAAKVSIPAGATSATYSLQITNDTLNENAETIILAMNSPVNATLGAAASHTVTINDNDAMPTVQFSLAAQSVDENSGAAVATVTLSAASGKAITVNYSPGGNANNLTANRTKYNLSAGTLTIPAGSTSTLLNVPLVNDSLPGASDFYISLSLAAPTNATLGSTAFQTITIIDNDPASPIGVEGFRTTVWPLARARCIGCHGASAALPNFASDDLTTAYTAAKPKADFINISMSKLAIKSGDGHCGANCTVATGVAPETRPLMIEAITKWATFETQTQPAPTPTPLPTMNSGTLAFRDAPNYIQFVTASVGLDPNNYQYATPYTDLITRLSPDGEVGAISAPMLLAYTTMASKVCDDLVIKERALAINNAGRVAFGPIDFATNTNIATAVLSPANVNTVTMNLARLYWRRDALATEQTEMFNMVSGAIQGRTLNSTDTSRVMVLMCTTVASALESLQY